jgi:hypothetical protein
MEIWQLTDLVNNDVPMAALYGMRVISSEGISTFFCVFEYYILMEVSFMMLLHFHPMMTLDPIMPFDLSLASQSTLFLTLQSVALRASTTMS